jgi:hypothetical protein
MEKKTEALEQQPPEGGKKYSRREFVKSSAATLSVVALGAGCASAAKRTSAFTPIPEKIRMGIIGCGGRGTDAAINCVTAAPHIEICALGDLFEDRVAKSKAKLLEKTGEAFNITNDRCFVGFDAYQGVLQCDVDLVILAAPPHYRPEHLRASIEAGKHVFMEKPVTVDPEGVRAVIAASDLARTKGLGIVAGTQRRHEPRYVETMKRILDGAIGEIVSAQCYWNQEGLWLKERQPEWTEMEYQHRAIGFTIPGFRAITLSSSTFIISTSSTGRSNRRLLKQWRWEEEKSAPRPNTATSSIISRWNTNIPAGCA